MVPCLTVWLIQAVCPPWCQKRLRVTLAMWIACHLCNSFLSGAFLISRFIHQVPIPVTLVFPGIHGPSVFHHRVSVVIFLNDPFAYKADNTALGGTTAQNGVSAFRDYDLTAANNVIGNPVSALTRGVSCRLVITVARRSIYSGLAMSCRRAGSHP